MSNSVELTIKTKIADGNDNDVLRDIYEATRSSVTERVYKKYQVADAVTDQPIVLDSVDAVNFILLRSDQNITLKIGGTDAMRAISLKKALTDAEGATERALFMATVGNDTLLYVSNASGAVANIEVILF